MALWEDQTFYYNSGNARTINPPESKKDWAYISGNQIQ